MKMNRRLFVAGAVGAALTAALPAFAQTAGKDYTPIVPAHPTEDAGKIEVLEFFSYGCPHCNEFNPLLSAWAAKQSADVVLKKVPVTFGRASWANIARLYYALDAIGEAHRLEAEVFKAIHVDRLNIFEERAMAEWVGQKGVDPKKFADVFNSFGVMSRVKRADQMAQTFRISGVPALAIEGKYLVGGKDFADTLAIADKLIAKSRSEKTGKK